MQSTLARRACQGFKIVLLSDSDRANEPDCSRAAPGICRYGSIFRKLVGLRCGARASGARLEPGILTADDRCATLSNARPLEREHSAKCRTRQLPVMKWNHRKSLELDISW